MSTSIRWVNVLIIASVFFTACGGPAPTQSALTDQVVVEPCPYVLPWPTAGDVAVSQSISDSSNLTHTPSSLMEYAVDFALPEGTPVIASRRGKVSSIHDGETAYGGQEYRNNANFVIVDHKDGTYTLYLHLQKVVVDEGDEVQQGELMGYSGKTGWTYGRPHLHFQVQARGDGFGQSIPFCFSDVPGGIPSQGTVLGPGDELPEIGGEVSGEAVAEPESVEPVPPQPLVSQLAYVVEDNAPWHIINVLGPDIVHHTLIAVGSSVEYDWSPDGIEIAYTQRSLNGTASTVKLFNPDPFKGRTLVMQAYSPAGPAFSPTFYYYGNPRWSPDGRSVYYLAADGRVVGDTLRRVDVSSGRIQELSGPRGSFDFDIAMTDGSIVLREWFNGLDGHGVFLLDAEGNQIRTLLDPSLGLFVYNVRFSPDGKSIAFTAKGGQFGQGQHIWVMNRDGSDFQQVTNDDRYSDSQPDWSSDGNWIAFTRVPVEGETSDIWIVSLDGKTLINLTNTLDASETNPAWRP